MGAFFTDTETIGTVNREQDSVENELRRRTMVTETWHPRCPAPRLQRDSHELAGLPDELGQVLHADHSSMTPGIVRHLQLKDTVLFHNRCIRPDTGNQAGRKNRGDFGAVKDRLN